MGDRRWVAFSSAERRGLKELLTWWRGRRVSGGGGVSVRWDDSGLGVVGVGGRRGGVAHGIDARWARPTAAGVGGAGTYKLREAAWDALSGEWLDLEGGLVWDGGSGNLDEGLHPLRATGLEPVSPATRGEVVLLVESRRVDGSLVWVIVSGGGLPAVGLAYQVLQVDAAGSAWVVDYVRAHA